MNFVVTAGIWAWRLLTLGSIGYMAKDVKDTVTTQPNQAAQGGTTLNFDAIIKIIALIALVFYFKNHIKIK